MDLRTTTHWVGGLGGMGSCPGGWGSDGDEAVSWGRVVVRCPAWVSHMSEQHPVCPCALRTVASDIVHAAWRNHPPGSVGSRSLGGRRTRRARSSRAYTLADRLSPASSHGPMGAVSPSGSIIGDNRGVQGGSAMRRDGQGFRRLWLAAAFTGLSCKSYPQNTQDRHGEFPIVTIGNSPVSARVLGKPDPLLYGEAGVRTARPREGDRPEACYRWNNNDA